MNLARISELDNLLNRLRGILRKLNERRENLNQEALCAKSAQEKLDIISQLARNRVSTLAAFGVRSEFLEEIICPVENTPDCSGIGVVVRNEISGIEDEIQQTNSQIWSTDQEKRQLEMEDAV